MRDTREHWVRFLMSILAVVLATAFVSATFSFTNMLGDSINKISDSTITGDIYVRGPEIEGDTTTFGPIQRAPISVDLVSQIESVDGVKVAAPGLFGTAILVGPDGKAVSNAMAPTLAGVLVEGIDQYTVLEGRMPVGREEIVLEEKTFDSSGYKIGDVASVTLGGSQTLNATIVGKVDSGWSLMGATFVFVSEEAGLAAYAPTGLVSDITVATAEGADVEAVLSAIQAEVGADYNVISADTLREESKSSQEQAMGFVETFMLVFAFIALFVGSFLIANTFSMLVRQRQREFALLRAIGASPRQVVGSLLVQAAIIALVGSVLGILAGVGIVMLAQQYFDSIGAPMEGDAWLEPSRAILVLVLAVVFTCVASLLPARQAATTAPVEAMRPEDPKPERTTVIRGILAALFVVAGLALIWMALDQTDAILLGIGAFLVLLGILGLGPLIVPPVLGLLALPFRVARPIGTLARGNVLRNPKRTSATAAALTIGMTFVSAAAVLASSADVSTRSIIDNQMSADYYVGSQMSSVPQSLLDEVGHLDAVSGVTPTYLGIVRAKDPAGDMSISAMSQQGYNEMITIPIIEGQPVAAADEIVISKYMWEEVGIELGDTVTFVVPGSGDVTMKVVGVTNDNFMFTDLYALDSGYEQLVPDQARAIMFLLVNSRGDMEQTRAQLEEAITALPTLSVLDRAELADQTVGTISTMMNILYALLGLSLVIAVLSIINTLAMAVMERTREIGLMRAVGLGGGQLVGMIMVESVLTALFGAMMGMLLGVSLGATLPAILSDMGLTTLAIPWDALLGILGGTVVVGVVAALWPAWRALRQPVLQAVASE